MTFDCCECLTYTEIQPFKIHIGSISNNINNVSIFDWKDY